MHRSARLLACLILVGLACTLGLQPLEAAPTERNPQPSTPLFVDTDIGIDDAVAIAWLLRQSNIDIVGFSTVYGNTSVENATRNLLTLLDTAEVQETVTIGAEKPLLFPRTRTGAFIHGPDGFWFAQRPRDISTLPKDAPAAIAQAARAHPGLTVIALGPLTNIAQAVQRYPNDLAGVRLVAVSGGKSGNRTPVAEYNAFADPQALDTVLASKMKVELVTLEAFNQMKVHRVRFVDTLRNKGGAVGQLLAQILPSYFQAGAQGDDSTQAAIPDAVAAIYAVQSDLGTPTSALVRVITDGGFARGQTIIADTLAGRVPMIANDEELSTLNDQLFIPGFDFNAALFAILQRQPDNANVVLDVTEWRMARLLERSLTR